MNVYCKQSIDRKNDKLTTIDKNRTDQTRRKQNGRVEDEQAHQGLAD